MRSTDSSCRQNHDCISGIDNSAGVLLGRRGRAGRRKVGWVAVGRIRPGPVGDFRCGSWGVDPCGRVSIAIQT